jgi:3-oxoacyl-[acyl-carrier protein] reductase
MDYGLKGRTAVVTGADSGMGLAVAKMLLDEGTRVLISDKAEDSIAAAGQGLAASGEVHVVAADLTQNASVERLRDSALERLGQVDILVNAAGVTGPTGLFHEIDDEAWLGALQIDLMGAVRVVRAFVPHMMERGYGRIVLFGSEDAEQPYPDELPYCAAKAAILNLSKGLSKAYAKHGILVNAVSPAFVATPMTDAMMEKRSKEKGSSFGNAVESFLKEERPTLELQRRGEAEEVAAAVLFLCSRHASFITGSNLRVDGGSVATV